MAALGRFAADTIEILARRAAMICSNPDCGTSTVGPTVEQNGSINIGEAAHIYGLTPKSARHNASLSPAELGDITNGVWLCRNCHKTVDNDATRHPVELLFQWRRIREADAFERLGKPGELLREKVKSDRLKQFSNISYLAQQIILDKPDHWEYKLTLEVLRSELGPLGIQWSQLKRGMYVRAAKLISMDQIVDWMDAKVADIGKMVHAMHPLLDDLKNSWGDPGISGDDTRIVAISRLMGDLAYRMIEWEEDIRFSHVPSEYKALVDSLQGIGGRQLEEIFRIPIEIAKIFETDPPSGYNCIQLVFEMPPDFESKFEAAIRRILA